MPVDVPEAVEVGQGEADPLGGSSSAAPRAAHPASAKISTSLCSSLPNRSRSFSISCLFCRFSQNRSDVPKNRASRRAVSSVIPRLPWTISLIRRGGTLMPFASRYWLNPIGFKKSSSRTPPGWIGVNTFFLTCSPSDSRQSPLRERLLPATRSTRATVRSHGCCIDRLDLHEAAPVDCQEGSASRPGSQPHRVERACAAPLVGVWEAEHDSSPA